MRGRMSNILNVFPMLHWQNNIGVFGILILVGNIISKSHDLEK